MNAKSQAAPLSYSRYRDKVLAGWIGKSFGGVIGARLENHKELKNIPLEEVWPEGKMIPNDDLDLQVVWLEAMQERGLFLTSEDLQDFWQDRCWYFFCEYGVFLNNVQRGIAPPLSGLWNNRFFKHSEGCPIRSDIWGFVAAGNPQLAAELAQQDGQLDHGSISIQTEQFLSAASAQAMLTDSLEEALAAGLSVIPPDSPIARAVPRVREIQRQYPDERQAWRVVIREFGHRNANDAVTNHALTLLALFAGKGDIKRTLHLCANFGWDTDCTASTAGALLGALQGTAGMPQDWLEKLGKNLICGISVKHRNATLADFAEDTCKIGVEMAAVRNPAVQFIDAPVVEIRPKPAPKITLEVEYVGEPVLWNTRETKIILKITNPFEAEHKGALLVALPDGVTFELAAPATTLAPQSVTDVEATIRRTHVGGWISDKNLFRATWEEGGGVCAERIFGLGGAREWQVYGPYWDMWDKTANEVCPYCNDEYVAGPFMVQLTGDCYNQYVRLDAPYLDEAKLLTGDLPQEVPLRLESGEDFLNDSDFGGFRGQACYYLVRTFRSTQELDVNLLIGRTGPYRAWLDGVELGSSDKMRMHAVLDDANLKIHLTGKPQRLVIKLARLTDAYDFSLFFIGRGDPEYVRGISNILDCLEDLVP